VVGTALDGIWAFVLTCDDTECAANIVNQKYYYAEVVCAEGDKEQHPNCPVEPTRRLDEPAGGDLGLARKLSLRQQMQGRERCLMSSTLMQKKKYC